MTPLPRISPDRTHTAMSSLKQIRSTFLDYFAADGHEKVHSAPLVPQNDPTLLFVNAGMVPFKDYFTGASTPPYPRATSSQKCVRAGGKHNDLDNVGYTARHLTFFEMLGNFSFGDYFKEHAIDRAWTLVTRDFGLDPKRLLVTVYIDDDEAAAIWKKVTGFGDDKIIRIAGSDNFWAMGDNGPCGPCTEIFWDYGDHVPGGPPGSPDEDGDRFVEIWNNVFMQFEKENDEIVRSLPKPSVDTGMGLERIASVLQGKNSVFDTDLFQTLITASAEATSTDPTGDMAASHRVIADHLRSLSFLIADGVTLERGPRLCPAPDHAPRHAPRPPAGRRRPPDAPAGADPRQRDGRGLPRAEARPGLRRGYAEAGRDPLPHHARPRHGPAGGRLARPRRGRRPVGPDRLYPL